MSRPTSAAQARRRLAVLLRRRREDVIQRWMRRVLADPRVAEANRLSKPDLRDQVPELLDALIRRLDQGDATEAKARALASGPPAKEHARQRAQTGYQTGEALRELSHFRGAILDVIAEERVTVTSDVARPIHQGIDESMGLVVDAIEGLARETGERLTDLLQESHEAVMLWLLGGGIVTWNRGAEELYGFTAEEAIGKDPHALLRTQHPTGMRAVDLLLAQKGRWEGELRQTAHDGREVMVESRLVVRPVPGQTLILEMNRDVTERRQAEKEREQLLGSERAARAEAERAAHLRDEFVATVSHELRSPLNAILGWTGMLRSGRLDAATTQKAFEVVERNARAQAELVEDLLDISRIGSGKLRLDVRAVDLGAATENVIASHLPDASAKGVLLDKELDAGPCLVRGDPARLEQIASNLISNAIKFTPRGGRVVVRCQCKGPHVTLDVEDTGKGIHRDFLPHVFERFRQAEASLTRHHRGLGLGLALVKFLVEQHGGVVRAESAGEGRGATFTVTLPVAAVEAAAQRASPIAACASLAGVKVLVVDDEEDARMLLSRILEDCHVQVTTASSAVEALATLVRVRPDVLISDIGMPELDGYQLIRTVRALAPEQGGATPAVALTAFARPEERVRALQAGYQIHLAKPVDSAELKLVVANVTGRLEADPRGSA